MWCLALMRRDRQQACQTAAPCRTPAAVAGGQRQRSLGEASQSQFAASGMSKMVALKDRRWTVKEQVLMVAHWDHKYACDLQVSSVV